MVTLVYHILFFYILLYYYISNTIIKACNHNIGYLCYIWSIMFENKKTWRDGRMCGKCVPLYETVESVLTVKTSLRRMIHVNFCNLKYMQNVAVLND